jgi:hypothetical protein
MTNFRAWLRASSLLAAVAVATPSLLRAQDARRGSITVTVYDSLHSRPLRDALVSLMTGVSIEGEARTDSMGVIRLANITPGTYDIIIIHPLLDSLGIGLRKNGIDVGESGKDTATVGVPSAKGVIKRWCPLRDPEKGGITGFVRLQKPPSNIPNARITVEWVAPKVAGDTSKGAPVGRETSTTDEEGRFTVCGIPGNVSIVVRATHGEVMGRTVLKPLPENSIVVADVTLTEFIPVLTAVEVNANAPAALLTAADTALNKTGFFQRRKERTGKFLSPDDIARIPATTALDLLKNNAVLVADGNIVRTARTRVVGMSQSYEPICAFVDHVPVQNTGEATTFEPPGWLDVRQIGAIEIFNSTNAPTQYQIGGQHCAVILIWTKALLGSQ